MRLPISEETGFLLFVGGGFALISAFAGGAVAGAVSLLHKLGMVLGVSVAWSGLAVGAGLFLGLSAWAKWDAIQDWVRSTIKARL